jgi:hypothetical protein
MATSTTASSPKAASQPSHADGVEKPEPIVIEAAKIGLGTAGAALIAYLAYRLARRKDDRSNFLSAAIRFREAFTPELAAAEADAGNRINYMEFLRAAHDERHTQAVIAFEHFLPVEKLRGFTDDWNRYRYGENADGSVQEPDPEDMDHESLYFLEYSIEWDLRRPERPRENTIKRIRKLLSHTSDA